MIVVFLWLIVLCLMWSLWDSHRSMHRCRYCGGDFGRHKQDCPVDYLTREERD